MTEDVPYRCACGGIEGELTLSSRQSGTRYVCHCRDCQAFAHHLGRADEVLDANGGTAVLQTDPGAFRITRGQDRLACVGVTDGPLLRWYCETCKSPVANTMSSGKWPFLSLILAHFGSEAGDDRPGRDGGHVFTDSAYGDLGDVKRASVAAMIGRAVYRIIRSRLGGSDRRSPFFDPASGAPIREPRRLSAEERQVIDERLDAAARAAG